MISLYKAILFDFFDVFRTDAYKAWLKLNGIPHEGEYFAANRAQDMGEITREQFLQRLSELSGKVVTQEELDKSATVNQEVVALARAVKAGYQTALISNAPSALIRGLLNKHALAALFDEIVVSSEVGTVKPDPKIFKLTLDKLKVKPEEAIFIDDNPSHTKGAEKVGITSIVFTSAAQLKRELTALGAKI